MKYIIALVLALFIVGGCQTSLPIEDYVGDPVYTPLADIEEVKDETVKPGEHPYFDGATLEWYRDATADAAFKSGRPIILEVGRKNCGLCQKFVEDVLPKFKEQLKGWVGLESNVDKMNKKVRKIVLDNMKHATLLPVVIVLDKNGNYVGGLYGDIRKQEKEFKALLIKANKVQ